MIQINQLKVLSTKQQKDLTEYIADFLRVSREDILSYEIIKKSIDARKKPEIYYVYSIYVYLKQKEAVVLRKMKHNQKVMEGKKITYQMPSCGSQIISYPPVIVGAGPAGLFCAYLLSMAGFCPVVLERGATVEQRKQDIATFWETGCLNTSSNVQFGEGGAGTFSDGKLNTLVKDKTGKNQFVLDTFVKFGAPEEIRYDAKPHIGTDILIRVIENMRKEIISLGGQFFFREKMEDIIIEKSKLTAVRTEKRTLDANVCVLAIGHSARDTFQLLQKKKILMSAKEFAVGFRVEHPQSMINQAQYGDNLNDHLPVAPYKLATKLSNGRGVYSFCMCPGGYVVNASSQENRLVVNGMSYSKRDSSNANSAIVVSVGAKEFGLDQPLAAMEYQMMLEEKAFQLCNGNIPQQLYGDFLQKKVSSAYGEFSSVTKGATSFADLNPLFSEEMRSSFLEGMDIFGKKIKGFDRLDAILSGIESRTSSPVRIHRNEALESNVQGIYPCGEGAGYAGGITSAAMDGMKIAEEIIRKYKGDNE